MPTKKFIDHLGELRLRLFWWLIVLIIGTLIGYLLRSQLQAIILKPISGPLYYTSPIGGFDFVLRISLYFGLIISFPFLIFNLYKFCQPALPDKIKLSLPKLFFLSLLLTAIGVSFAHFVAIPASMHFLAEFGTDRIVSLISTNEYLSFITAYFIGFGLLFQMPVIFILINSIVQLDLHFLMGKQVWVVLISFILAAILTPTPDPVNQSIMAIPIILLYEFSILIIWISRKRQKA